MENLVSKVSYLKGLAEGLEIDKETKDGKLLSGIIDVLSDIALAVDDLLDAHEELEEKVDEIDSDLADIEEIAYGDDDDEYGLDDEDEFDDDMDFFEIECPNCHELIQSHRACPSCGYYGQRKVVEIKTKSND